MSTTAAPDDENFSKPGFGKVNFVTDGGFRINHDDNDLVDGAPHMTVTGGGGGGGAGGAGGSFVWASTGGNAFAQPPTEAEKDVIALKERVAELEAKLSEKEDIEYFRRNMYKAIKLPYKLSIGPNDILIVHVGVRDIPPGKVEDYLKKAKRGVQDLFDERGLKGRVLWCPEREGTDVHFSVIEIGAAQKMHMRYNPLSNEEDVSLPIRQTGRPKPKFDPPVMG